MGCSKFYCRESVPSRTSAETDTLEARFDYFAEIPLSTAIAATTRLRKEILKSWCGDRLGLAENRCFYQRMKHYLHCMVSRCVWCRTKAKGEVTDHKRRYGKQKNLECCRGSTNHATSKVIFELSFSDGWRRSLSGNQSQGKSNSRGSTRECMTCFTEDSIEAKVLCRII